MTFDTINQQIIETLQRDGGLSISDLAKQLDMTTPPCWRRVNALKKKGILKQQVWLADPAALGLHVLVIATVKLVTHDSHATAQFKNEVQKIKEIVECYILLGERDAMLKIVVPSITYYEDLFYKRISQIPGVQEVVSSVIMSEVKHTTSLPILSIARDTV